MAANLIPSSHSFRFISLSGSIPKMEINRRIRKMLWHNTFTDIIENTAPFSKTFTLAILTLVNVALNGYPHLYMRVTTAHGNICGEGSLCLI